MPAETDSGVLSVEVAATLTPGSRAECRIGQPQSHLQRLAIFMAESGQLIAFLDLEFITTSTLSRFSAPGSV